MELKDLGGNPFRNGSGRFAVARFKAAIAAGKGMKSFSPAELRTLDTLRHEEWKHFDKALLEEAVIQLKGVADLQAAGLVKPVANSLGKTVFAYEKITDMDDAIISLNGMARSDNDRQEYEMDSVPLPMIHKDFFLNLRALTASRDQGEALDTTQVRTAGRRISEMAEQMLFQGGPEFGGKSIYGYTTHPSRHIGTYGTHGDWTQASKTGPDILADVLGWLQVLENARMYGPYWIYASRDASLKLEDDYNPTFSTKTTRQRLMEINGVQKLEIVDKLPAATVIVVNATMDTVCWVQGETLQTVQWDEAGGFLINFKAFQIGVPLIRVDAQSRCGILHAS